jgi:hypothetical protein
MGCNTDVSGGHGGVSVGVSNANKFFTRSGKAFGIFCSVC